MASERILKVVPRPPTGLVDRDGAGFWRRLANGGVMCCGSLVLTDQRVVLIRTKGLWKRIRGFKVDSVWELDDLLASHGGLSFKFSDTEKFSVADRVSATGSVYSDLSFYEKTGTAPKIFRLPGYDTADEVFQLIPEHLKIPISPDFEATGDVEPREEFDDAETPCQILRTKLLRYDNELKAIPTGAQRREILMTWTSALDRDAHDYLDFVASHPQRDDILQLHAETVILAYMSGHLASRRWLEESVASQAAFELGRSLRDQIRQLDISLDGLSPSLGVVIDEALNEVMQLGLQG